MATQLGGPVQAPPPPTPQASAAALLSLQNLSWVPECRSGLDAAGGTTRPCLLVPVWVGFRHFINLALVLMEKWFFG